MPNFGTERILRGAGAGGRVCTKYVQLHDDNSRSCSCFDTFLLWTPLLDKKKSSYCNRARLAWRITEARLERRDAWGRERLVRRITWAPFLRQHRGGVITEKNFLLYINVCGHVLRFTDQMIFWKVICWRHMEIWEKNLSRLCLSELVGVTAIRRVVQTLVIVSIRCTLISNVNLLLNES
jgi:hypothetical protein